MDCELSLKCLRYYDLFVFCDKIDYLHRYADESVSFLLFCNVMCFAVSLKHQKHNH